MQRYHVASSTTAVNNSGIGGPSTRDTGRADSSPLSGNFSINPRRSSPQLTPYKLKCDREPLNPRLGPPDFQPQTPNCPEETFTREYVLSGYRETVEGLEDSKEISLTQISTFTKPAVLKCKEAIRKRLRAINETRAQKRKAGQVYGVPLSGSLLSKLAIFPEQKPYSEDFRKRWIEGLSQNHKSLHLLADHVPHGFRKKSLFEALIRNNVPLLRATWFIKVTYLNQIRPGVSGTPDKTYVSRSELWTKDICDYLQHLLDESLSRSNSHSIPHNRDRSPQTNYAGLLFNKSDTNSATPDGEEPSLHFKWWYMVQLIHWHLAEALILPSQMIDWVLLQLQERDLFQALQFLLPIVHGVINAIILSQTYVRKLVDICLHFLRDTSAGATGPVDNPQRTYLVSVVIEILRYLVLSVPDAFVALDCFPLPHSVVNFTSTGDIQKRVSSSGRDKLVDVHYQSLCFNHTVSSIQKYAMSLRKAASPGHLGHSIAKVVQALGNALVLGDIQEAYEVLFEDFSDVAVVEPWVAAVNPILRSLMKWIGSVSSSFICSVFLLCEWCTCDFRDFRTVQLDELKFTGRKDFSQIYIAVRLLMVKMKDLRRPSRDKKCNFHGAPNMLKSPGLQNTHDDKSEVQGVSVKDVKSSDIFESPGPLHDIIVCWLDQHETRKGERSKRVELLLVELIRCGIFYPQSYVRQLIVSGVIDGCGLPVDLERRKKHFRILKQLPGPYIRDVLEDAQIADASLLSEAIHVYSNERRLLLSGLLTDDDKNINDNDYDIKPVFLRKHRPISERKAATPSLNSLKTSLSASSLSVQSSENNPNIEELKAAISQLLLLPNSTSSVEAGVDESQATVKRSTDLADGASNCEECRRAKRQKLGEERNPYSQGTPSSPFDDEDAWWLRKEPKMAESVKVDPPLKPNKQASRGRQKTVRKTQSLAQLAAARIEGSQGASTSHTCDNRVGCPHHNGMEESPKLLDGNRGNALCGDIVSIGNVLKRLRYVKKRAVAVWLVGAVKQLVEGAEKTVPKVGPFNRPISSADERSSIRWKLGEDELSAVLYLLDVSNDLASAVRFLIWLLPKAPYNSTTPIHSGRNMTMMQRNLESHACDVGESFLLSCIRRYENILVTADVVPDLLSSAMRRLSIIMASNGRVSGSSTLLYAHYLLNKYGGVSSVTEWEKNFKATSDRRLLSELESGRSHNGELGVAFGVPKGGEDVDDLIRQKITGNRLSRVGTGMRETVQRYVDEMLHHLFGKERKLFAAGPQKSAGIEKWDGGYQIAQQIIMGLLDCMRQTGGAAQEGDPSLVASAVSAIVGNVGPAIAKMPDFTTVHNHSNVPSPTGSLNFARRILRIHINCLCLLKEALGERHGRSFEIALASEASSALSGVLSPGKALESNASMPNDISNHSMKVLVGRAAKTAAAVSALVVGAVLHGVASLERMVRVFRLKEGLDVLQYVRSTRSNSNGHARSVPTPKAESNLEVPVHWFRLLVGNCRTVCDGLIVDLLGEPSVIALSRMQRTLPLDVVLPPAFSIFAFLRWRQFIFNPSAASRDDVYQLFQNLASAVGEAIKHAPFRDVCLRDSRGFCDIVTSDTTDSEFAATLELNGSDKHFKATTFVPLRARLFLNAVIDCKLPSSVAVQDDGGRVPGTNESSSRYADGEMKISDKLIHGLDSLQPAKFHWQWVELRLLLNEQTLIEKLDASEAVSIAEAMRSLSPNCEKPNAFENENNFIQIVLTRLLVRPDAAALFSEVVHLFGRSIEDSLLLQVKWFLGGSDVLFGRKSIRQRLLNIADTRKISTKVQFCNPWGWSHTSDQAWPKLGEKRKFESIMLEEGEVGDDGPDLKRNGRRRLKIFDVDSQTGNHQHITDRALIQLVLPCIDRSSDESRSSFVNDLIKQMSNIEQHITSITSGPSKSTGSSVPGNEGPVSKANTRKNMKGGSPGSARRSAVPVDSPPSSPSALRSSLSLRLQLLLRLLSTICANGEPSGMNPRSMLAPVIIRLLGSRVVYEDANISLKSATSVPSKRQAELLAEGSDAVFVDFASQNLFDWLLLTLHVLLSNTQPSWLRLRSSSKGSSESSKNFCGVDREMAESLQNELDRLRVPDTIRSRIQAAMPIIHHGNRRHISCQPPSVSSSALTALQPSMSLPSLHPGHANPSQKGAAAMARQPNNAASKAKAAALQPDYDVEVDPWLLLEDGAGAGPSSSSSGVVGSDHGNLRASSLLKGAVRVRRTDLTYIGTVDEDS
ncbi:hypothetical protein Droror1_Dr00000526 [Drosera rotundifolia]